MAVPSCLTWDGHGQNLIDHLQSLRIKELFFDLTLVCNGKYFPAHRCVLSSCSSYFEDILAKVPCQHPFLILNDVEEKDLKTLLDFMYQGKVTVFMDQLRSLLHAGKGLQIKGFETFVYPPTLCISADPNADIQREKKLLLDLPESVSPEFQEPQLSPTSLLNHCLDLGQELELKIEIGSDVEDDSLCHDPLPVPSQEDLYPHKRGISDGAEPPLKKRGSSVLEEKKLFHCPLCPYRTKYGGDLRKHLRTHTGEKPYSCNQCPFTTSDPSSLKNHSKAHNGQKPFRCAVCSFSTANQSSLKKHVRIHPPSA